jgi:TPR repeat protein
MRKGFDTMLCFRLGDAIGPRKIGLLSNVGRRDGRRLVSARTPTVLICVFCAALLCIPLAALGIAYIPPITSEQIAKIKEKAIAGDAGSENALGEWYQSGRNGFPKNLELVAAWYLKSAEQGVNQAQRAIGEMYEFGEGVRPDHEAAVIWIRKATVQYAASSMMIAGRYARGISTPQDLQKAIDWYRMSAEAGHVVAQTVLGELYENGTCVQNFAEAGRWYRAAAQMGSSDVGSGALVCDWRGNA